MLHRLRRGSSFLAALSACVLLVANEASFAAADDDGDAAKIADLWARPDFRDPAALDQADLAVTKINELQSMTTRCTSMLIGGDMGCGVITEINTAEEYARYVFQAPRPYHLFVLYSMGGCCNLRKGHCNKDCNKAEDSFRKMAASYHVLGEHSNSYSTPDDIPADPDKQPVFFAIVHCDARDRETKQKSMMDICKKAHKFEHVPKLTHVRSQAFKRRSNTIQFRPQHSYSTADWNDHNKLFNWVRGFAGRDSLVLYQDLFARIALMAPIVMYGSAALAVAVLGAVLVRQLPILMVFGAAAIQWLGCSGITYNLIHGMNWHGHNNEYFARSNRSQYVYEGLGCSGLFMIAGFMLVVLAMAGNKKFKSKYTASLMTFLCSVGILGAASAVWILMSIYKSYKAGWYSSPGFYPPDGYRTGSLAGDRGFTTDFNVEKGSSGSGSGSGSLLVGAMLAGAEGVMSVFSFNAAVYNYFHKKTKQSIKSVKKTWMTSDAVAGVHKLLVKGFDIVYNPVSYLFTGKSSSKKKRR